MAETFTVSIDGEVSDKEADKIRQTLQKSLAKWFKQGLDIKVRRH